MIQYMIINIMPRKVLAPQLAVWEVHGDLLSAERSREHILKSNVYINPDNFQVISVNNPFGNE